MLGRIWVKTVCKGYEQTKLVGNELNFLRSEWAKKGVLPFWVQLG